MNKDIEKLNKERNQILQQVQLLDQQKGELITRLAELQGIIKYLTAKEEKKEVKDNGK